MKDKHIVNIRETILDGIIQKKGLVPTLHDNQSFYEHFMDCYCGRIRHNYKSFDVSNLVLFDSNYSNPLFRIIFNGLLYAETKFITNFIPQNSHEERLTGHLISEYYNGLEIIKNSFIKKSKEIYGRKLGLDFYYADLSSNNKEKFTGADFGIIFHVNLPGTKEYSKCQIFQAKKLKSVGATIERDQHEALLKYSENYGLFCFYDMELRECSSPLVYFANNFQVNEDSKSKIITRKEVFEKKSSMIIPVSVFLVFDFLEKKLGFSRKFDTIWQARNYMLKEQFYENQPEKILVVSIGGFNKKDSDITNLRDLFNFNKE